MTFHYNNLGHSKTNVNIIMVIVASIGTGFSVNGLVGTMGRRYIMTSESHIVHFLTHHRVTIRVAFKGRMTISKVAAMAGKVYSRKRILLEIIFSGRYRFNYMITVNRFLYNGLSAILVRGSDFFSNDNFLRFTKFGLGLEIVITKVNFKLAINNKYTDKNINTTTFVHTTTNYRKGRGRRHRRGKCGLSRWGFLLGHI